MKKKISVTLIELSILFICTSNLFSQENKYFASLSGGFSSPVELVEGSSFKTGFSIDCRAGKIASNHLALGIESVFNQYNPQYSDEFRITGGKKIILQFRGFMMFRNFESKSEILPYGIFSVGLDFIKTNEMQSIAGNTESTGFESTPALGIGGGIVFKTSSKSEFFIESNFTLPLSGGTNFVPVSVRGGMNVMF